MWTDSNLKINNILNDLNERNFPSKCPICNCNECHLYITRFKKDDSRGSGWIWCSSCKSYSHFQYKIPEKWTNLESIDLMSLNENPDYLEKNKNIIDKYVNEFLNSLK